MCLLAEERPNGGTQFLCKKYKDFTVQESISYSSSLLPATALPQLSSFPPLLGKKKKMQAKREVNKTLSTKKTVIVEER